jgi:hypothetical protein
LYEREREDTILPMKVNFGGGGKENERRGGDYSNINTHI